MFHTILIILTVGLVIYYIGAVSYDVYKAKALKTADQSKVSEEEIDISDEVSNFQTIELEKDPTEIKESHPDSIQESADNIQDREDDNGGSAAKYKAPLKYDEPFATGGMTAEELCHVANEILENPDSMYADICGRFDGLSA